MGKLSGMFGDLTNTQLATPGGPNVSSPDPGQVAHAMSQTAQPSMQDPTSGGFTAPPQGPQPTVSKPSFLQAMSTGPGGTPNALSPGLTKGGKLLTILMAAAKGGLAGQAAGMQGNPRTGYGGFGAGAEAGMQLPFIQAQQKQALQEGQMQQQLQQAQIQNLPFARQAQQAGLAKTQAETKKAQAETDLLPSKEDLNAARTAEIQNKQATGPDLQHLYAQAVQSGDTAGAQKYADAIQAVQKEAAPKTPNRDDRAIAIMQKPEGQRTPEEASYLKAYRAFVKENKIDPSVMRAEIFTGNRAVPVADDQGNVTYKRAKDAIAAGAQTPASAGPAAAKAVKRDFTSGTSAKALNAFNTATNHLQLLDKLGDALGNGDITSLNQLAQVYKTQTGNPAPTNFNMAKNAVAGEIAKTFKGNATEGEISAINSTINNAMSPMALKGAIQTATELMASKKQALQEQYKQGLQGQPAFNNAAAPAPTSADPLGIR